ncbi:hypothetical protein [Chlorogloea sp. CCALA 695]|nr:hypothetical protein [Chlorogloea sp. CCALA 695]
MDAHAHHYLTFGSTDFATSETLVDRHWERTVKQKLLRLLH